MELTVGQNFSKQRHGRIYQQASRIAELEAALAKQNK